MKSTAILLLPTLLLFLVAAGCGYGSNYNAMRGAVPRIAQLTPQNVIANSGTFTLTIEGSGFTSGSLVYWNNTALAATVNSNTQLTVGISAHTLPTCLLCMQSAHLCCDVFAIRHVAPSSPNRNPRGHRTRLKCGVQTCSRWHA